MKKSIAKKLAKLVIKKDKLVHDLLAACTELREEWRSQYLEMERLKTHCLDHPDDKAAKRALKRKTFIVTRTSREYTATGMYLRSLRDVDNTRLPGDVQDQVSLLTMADLAPPTE